MTNSHSHVLQRRRGGTKMAAQLFIGRLPRDCKSRDLEDIFYKYGKMTRCDVKTGIKMSYGFIEYEDRRDAEDAIHNEHGRELDGSRIVVEWARGPKYDYRRDKERGGDRDFRKDKGRDHYDNSRDRDKDDRGTYHFDGRRDRDRDDREYEKRDKDRDDRDYERRGRGRDDKDHHRQSHSNERKSHSRSRSRSPYDRRR